MKDTVKIAAIILVACVMSVPASAIVTTPSEKVTVSFGDLNLKHESAQKTLYNRVKAAASRVCGPTQIRLAGSVSRIVENKACYNEAITEALDSLGIPAVSELHNQQRRTTRRP